MCTIIDSYIEQGAREARIILLRNAIQGGMSEEQLINVLEFTPEEIKAVKATMSVIRKSREDFRKQ